ncbi:MAG: HAD-IIIA family hydrolase, partial [Candidatus Diapherotrites archaeon]|nr:HAD-IIIA family hydrolase [Candidatus Diapherotrites archaeon]
RLGYVIANKKIISDLSRTHNFKSINVLAQIAGETSLQELHEIKQYSNEVNESISLICKELPKLGFEVCKTHAGFVLFRHKTLSVKNIVVKLEQSGIFVRDITKILPDKEYLRMNLGTVFQTQKLLKLFKKLFLIKAVFVDRDGTIVFEPSGPNPGDDGIYSVSELKLLPNAIKGLKKLQEFGYMIFTISNQDGISYGRLTLKTYNQMSEILEKEFFKHGIQIEKWLVCPHKLEENCNCKKPKTGMVDALKSDYCFDFNNSYCIGDRNADVELAKNLGAKGILVRKNEVLDYKKTKVNPSFKAKNILQACGFVKKLIY